MSYNPLVKHDDFFSIHATWTFYSQNLCIRNAVNYLLADPPGFTWEIMRLENNSFVNLKDDTTLVLNL